MFNLFNNKIYELNNGKGCISEYNEITEELFKGEYSNGKRNGKGIEYNQNNELGFEGEYLNGKRW